MPKIRVYPYKMYSSSAKTLAKSLGVLRVWPKKYVPKFGDVVINWGNSKFPEQWLNKQFHFLNNPENVAISCNKLRTFQALQGVCTIPDWTTDPHVVELWLDEGHTVLARTLLSSHSGKGIKILKPDVDDIPYAPLFTKYKKKKDEYRVHIFMGDVIDFTQKKQKVETKENTNFQIRSHSSGWIYARDGVEPPAKVFEEAKKAVAAIGLDFGAVDIGYNTHYDEATVYEVNSAPGLYGTTLNRYWMAFKDLLEI